MPTATARHILVATEAQCLQLKNEIEDGADFAEVARKKSSCPSRAQGGDLGAFRPGQMVKEFDEVVFSGEVNKVLGPVKTQFGYHLIKVEERDPAHSIDAYTLQQKKYDAFQTWLTDQRNAAKIQRNWSLNDVPPTPSASQG